MMLQCCSIYPLVTWRLHGNAEELRLPMNPRRSMIDYIKGALYRVTSLSSQNGEHAYITSYYSFSEPDGGVSFCICMVETIIKNSKPAFC